MSLTAALPKNLLHLSLPPWRQEGTKGPSAPSVERGKPDHRKRKEDMTSASPSSSRKGGICVLPNTPDNLKLKHARVGVLSVNPPSYPTEQILMIQRIHDPQRQIALRVPPKGESGARHSSSNLNLLSETCFSYAQAGVWPGTGILRSWLFKKAGGQRGSEFLATLFRHQKHFGHLSSHALLLSATKCPSPPFHIQSIGPFSGGTPQHFSIFLFLKGMISLHWGFGGLESLVECEHRGCGTPYTSIPLRSRCPKSTSFPLCSWWPVAVLAPAPSLSSPSMP